MSCFGRARCLYSLRQAARGWQKDGNGMILMLDIKIRKCCLESKLLKFQVGDLTNQHCQLLKISHTWFNHRLCALQVPIITRNLRFKAEEIERFHLIVEKRRHKPMCSSLFQNKKKQTAKTSTVERTWWLTLQPMNAKTRSKNQLAHLFRE